MPYYFRPPAASKTKLYLELLFYFSTSNDYVNNNCSKNRQGMSIYLLYRANASQLN